MEDRRNDHRMLCADLVDIEWQETCGAVQSAIVNLEDISMFGVCLQMEQAIPRDALVTVRHETGDFQGHVRYCVFKDIGYFVGIEFEAGYRWNMKQFKPMHLLDPRRLANVLDDYQPISPQLQVHRGGQRLR